MQNDPERPTSPRLSPEIGQQPMGRSARWPLWAVVVFLVAAIICFAWAAQAGWT